MKTQWFLLSIGRWQRIANEEEVRYNRLVETISRNLMREIQASEAKTHLPQLLTDVERGETIIITRHGQPIARLIPESQIRQYEIADAIARLKSFRETMPQTSMEELLEMQHEGHRY